MTATCRVLPTVLERYQKLKAERDAKEGQQCRAGLPITRPSGSLTPAMGGHQRVFGHPAF